MSPNATESTVENQPRESRLRSLLFGHQFTHSTYILSRWIFLRLLGVIYLIAFVSIWCQIDGLIGAQGILPVSEYLEMVREHRGSEAYTLLPTLCWLSPTDTMLHVLCAAGSGLAVLLIVGLLPIPSLCLLWMVYLSLMVAGQVFLSFQWDILLLEVGFCAMFVSPATWWERPSRVRPPSPAGICLLRSVLFKLMFLSGATKLLSGDDTWWQLMVLHVHYETQPLPTWVGWYAHQMPSWFHKISVAVMFVIELLLPFLIFGPRRIRHVAAGGLVLLQVLIAITGNYNFFNLLTVTLCVLLIDDRIWQRLIPRKFTGRLSEVAPPKRPNMRHYAVLIPVVLLIMVSSLTFLRELTTTHQRAVAGGRDSRLAKPLVQGLGFCDEYILTTDLALYVLNLTNPFHTINGYGLFRVMTTQRPEIVVEASHNGQEWREYGFAWKPGDLTGRPRFVQPHQPRLDWQMWFAALSPRHHSRWLEPFMRRLLEGSPEVLSLLASNPFPDDPPTYIRLVMYRYRFTDWPTRRELGTWWQRNRRAGLTGAVRLEDFH